jgi:imidazolonepropionase-like amidohydrolase
MLTRRKAAYNRGVRPLPLLLLPLLLCSCAKANKTTTIAITHATVINPGADHPVQPKATVLIQGNRVVAVGADTSTPVPADAQVIDGTGKFLIPGLADLHLHLTGAGEPSGSREFFFPLLVANGVTTVRDMGGDVAMLKKLKKEIESEETLGPQIFFTGPYLDGNPPSFQPSMVIEKPGDALPAVRRLKTEGVDFIKVQSRLKPDAFYAIAEAARQQNIRFVGHVPDSVSPAEAADAGQYSLEHLTGILLGCSSREDELREEQLRVPGPKETARQENARQRAWQQAVLDSYSPQKAQRLYAKFLADHTWQVPTLPLLIHLAFLTPARDLGEDAHMKFVPANLRNVWEQGRAESLANKGPADFVLRDKLLEASLKSVRDMHAAGIPMVAGTDAAAPNVIPGFSLQESIADFVQAGFTPQEALQTATSKPAEFLGRTQEQGSIAAGQRADLVLLDANPLEDIQNTQKIRAVVLNGKVLDRSALDGLLERAAKFAGRM